MERGKGEQYRYALLTVGLTDAQIKEAIATAALVRFNSTMLNGSDGGREWHSH